MMNIQGDTKKKLSPTIEQKKNISWPILEIYRQLLLFKMSTKIYFGYVMDSFNKGVYK